MKIACFIFSCMWMFFEHLAIASLECSKMCYERFLR